VTVSFAVVVVVRENLMSIIDGTSTVASLGNIPTAVWSLFVRNATGMFI
jgi:hypothetical protein